jgi:hypothetical protein
MVKFGVEAALTRYPIHRLAKQGIVPIEIRETDRAGEVTTRWEVSYNSKFGQPGPLAYKLDTIIINRRIEEARPNVPDVLRLGSLRRLARELGQGNDTEGVKIALLQNAGALIIAKIRYKDRKGIEQILESNFTRYEVHFAGERLPDGRKSNSVYLSLGETFRRILSLARTRPLNFLYLQELTPVAQRWYELASFRVYGVFQHKGSEAEMRYSWFCQHAPQTRYYRYGEMRRQMRKVLVPHLNSGYIKTLEFRVSSDERGMPDWIMAWQPGQKAKHEYISSSLKFKYEDAISISISKVPNPDGLVEALVERGVSDSVARRLTSDFSEDLIRKQIEKFDRLLKNKPGRIKDRGAYLYSQ